MQMPLTTFLRGLPAVAGRIGGEMVLASPRRGVISAEEHCCNFAPLRGVVTDSGKCSARGHTREGRKE